MSMDLITYFLRRGNLSKYHKTVEDIAALDECIDLWKDKVLPNTKDVRPVWMLEKLEKYRAERARLIVRKKRLENDLGLTSKPPV